MTSKRIPGIFAALACMIGSIAPARAADNSIHWLGDYRQALRQAKQTHQPILVEFRCEA